jgi:hypothetical protein
MGAVPIVSLPSVITCREGCTCAEKCYARKLERIRPAVRNAYRSNYDLLLTDPAEYWRGVETELKTSRFFRFHVSGDIPNKEYLNNMVLAARRNPHCRILCFTKKYEIVNEWLHSSRNHMFPENLQVIFSAWKGIEMQNPYNLPEAHVMYRDGTTTARPDATECGGNCTECAVSDGGCWYLEKGQQVFFHEH